MFPIFSQKRSKTMYLITYTSREHTKMDEIQNGSLKNSSNIYVLTQSAGSLLALKQVHGIQQL
jgi:hypothetical protein